MTAETSERASTKPSADAGAENAPVAAAPGDGIGPEIMEATLDVLEAAGASIDWRFIEVGESVYRRGFDSGLEPSVWDAIRSSRALLKGPVTTPSGGGMKSLNVTLRKTLGLFANVRPCRSYAPFVETHHPDMDLVVIRENEEDLYAGIEHRQTSEVVQCLKLITRPGCERIVRYAFEYASRRERKRLTCMTKDNIMKHTDGLFHSVFDEVAAEYPNVETDHLIIDIGMARVADQPERFDVIVVPNLYGDILSDVAAEISGSVGIAPSANIGEQGAMFEAIHGSAPDIAGQGIANPSGLILAAVKMLAHLGQGDVAARIHNAWLRTIEDGIHTADIHHPSRSTVRAGTREFSRELVQRLGEEPRALQPARYAVDSSPMFFYRRPPRPEKQLVGVDVFADWSGSDPDELAAKLRAAETGGLTLRLVTNRGVKVWPEGHPETFLTDHWRCRFEYEPGAEASADSVVRLLGQLAAAGVDFIKTEHLYTFDGERGYSLGQGQ